MKRKAGNISATTKQSSKYVSNAHLIVIIMMIFIFINDPKSPVTELGDGESKSRVE